MKFLFFSILILLPCSLLANFRMHEGGISSGGGKSVVCYRSDGTVDSVELLDIWEAKTLHGLNIRDSNRGVKEVIDDGLNNLMHSIYYKSHGGPKILYNDLREVVDLFLFSGNQNSVRRLRNVQLTLTDDSYEAITPTDCEIEQVVRYGNPGDILVNQDLVDKMDSVNVAYLYLHEAFYKILRGELLRNHYSEKSSVRVRRTIGLVASGHQFTHWASFVPKQYYRCWNHKNDVYVFLDRNRSGQATFMPIVVDGRPMIGNYENSLYVNVDSLGDLFQHDSYVTMFTGTLGDLTGNDFFYRFFISGKSATIQLISSPDQINSSKEHTIGCKRYN